LSSCVIGLPDDDLGSIVHALVQPSDQTLTEDVLRAWCGQRIAPYKLPSSFEWDTDALRVDGGMVRRSALRAERLDATQRPQPRLASQPQST
jgi:bile acid-coenzyme A ligase